jgi:hypothetical protein
LLSELKEEEKENSQLEESKDVGGVNNISQTVVNKSGFAQSILLPNSGGGLVLNSKERVVICEPAREPNMVSEMHKKG